MRNAFTYDYRMWTPVELKEALLESGFQKVHLYPKKPFGDVMNDEFPKECTYASIEDHWEIYIIGFA